MAPRKAAGEAKPRKPRATKAEKPPKAAAAPSGDVTRQISANKLKGLLKAAKATTADVRELSGSLGNKIAAAVEHDHLHRKAFSILRTLDRMEPEKLADLWDTLLFYVEISGLEDRIKSAPRMDFGSDEPQDPEEDEQADNVRPFRQVEEEVA